MDKEYIKIGYKNRQPIYLFNHENTTTILPSLKTDYQMLFVGLLVQLEKLAFLLKNQHPTFLLFRVVPIEEKLVI